jgi:hypothetical protein
MAKSSSTPTTRRSLMAGGLAAAAASSAIAGAALAIPIVDDPIFAAIERHRAAYKAFSDAIPEAERYELGLSRRIAHCGMRRIIFTVTAPPFRE